MSGLDKIIHQPSRLRIMATLMTMSSGDRIEFVYLRNLLKLSDGNLGAHLLKLERAGYVTIKKTFVVRKPRTFISPTAKGRSAFGEHIAALEKIIRG